MSDTHGSGPENEHANEPENEPKASPDIWSRPVTPASSNAVPDVVVPPVVADVVPPVVAEAAASVVADTAAPVAEVVSPAVPDVAPLAGDPTLPLRVADPDPTLPDVAGVGAPTPLTPPPPPTWGQPEFAGAPVAEAAVLTHVGSDAPPLSVPPKKKRNVGKLVGLTLGIAGIVAGGAFAFTQFKGGEKANTPVEAAESLFTAMQNQDAIGLAQALSPGERDLVLDMGLPVVKELSRLELLEKDVDLNKVNGFEAKLTNFKATSKVIRDDLAEVRITSGKLATSVDPKKVPLGSFLREVLGDNIDQAAAKGELDLTMDPEASPMIMQKVGKRWYLSGNYSLAEAARRDSDSPLAAKVPAKGGGVPARGADTPEKAVAEMMTAMGNFDVRRVIELMPPDEMPALHDYAGMFIAEAEKAMVEPKKIVKLDIAPVVSSKSLGKNKALVMIQDIPMTLAAEQDGTKVNATYKAKTFTGSVVVNDGTKVDANLKDGVLTASMLTPEGETVKADYRNECLTLTVSGEEKKGCGQKGIADMFSELTGQTINTADLSTSGFDIGQSCIPKNRAKERGLDVGMVTVKQGGKWYVSPFRSYSELVTSGLKMLDRKDFDCIRKQVEKAVATVQGQLLPGGTDPTFEASTGEDPFDTSTFDTSAFDDQFDSISDTLPLDEEFTPITNTLPADSDAGLTEDEIRAKFGSIPDTLPSADDDLRDESNELSFDTSG